MRRDSIGGPCLQQGHIALWFFVLALMMERKRAIVHSFFSNLSIICFVTSIIAIPSYTVQHCPYLILLIVIDKHKAQKKSKNGTKSKDFSKLLWYSWSTNHYYFSLYLTLFINPRNIKQQGAKERKKRKKDAWLVFHPLEGKSLWLPLTLDCVWHLGPSKVGLGWELAF